MTQILLLTPVLSLVRESSLFKFLSPVSSVISHYNELLTCPCKSIKILLVYISGRLLMK